MNIKFTPVDTTTVACLDMPDDSWRLFYGDTKVHSQLSNLLEKVSTSESAYQYLLTEANTEKLASVAIQEAEQFADRRYPLLAFAGFLLQAGIVFVNKVIQ